MKNKVMKVFVLFICIVICLCLSPVALAENNSGNGEIPDGVSPWSWLQSQFDQGGTVTLPQDITAGVDDTQLSITVGKTVILDLNGHTIDRNMSEYRSDGAVILVFGELILTDTGTNGVIKGSKNYSTGGVDVVGGKFTMNGGIISGNIAAHGGGVYVDAGEFIMNGGAISGNTATASGGGVGMSLNGGQFTMNNGTISGNTATDHGGGVMVQGGCTFTMNNGMISDNHTDTGTGGGVEVSSGTFVMSNGVISSNTAFWAGGVFVGNGNVIFSGNPVITGNTAKGVASNLYLENVYQSSNENKGIIINAALTNTTPIGVTVYPAATVETPKAFTSGLSSKGTAANFTSDNDSYIVLLNEDQEAMLAVPLQITMPEETPKGTVRISELNGTPVTQMPDYVLYHDVVTLTITPAEGYELAPDGLSVSWVDENDQLQPVELTQGTGDESDEWTFVMPSADVTVTVTFSPIVYSISYELDGGRFEDGTTVPRSYTIEDGEIVLPAPARWEDIFVGWYDNSAYEGETISAIPAGYVGDRTFYARFAPTNGWWGNLQWTYEKDSHLLNISGSGDIEAFQNNNDAWRPLAPIIGNVKLVSGVTAIGSYAFSDCINLTEIELSPTLERIDDYAFASDVSLTQIAIPYSVESIGEYAFSNCSLLTDVYYDGIEQQWEKIAIADGNHALTDATFHITSTVTDHGTWGALEWSLYNSGALVISGNGPMNGLGGNAAWLAHKEMIYSVFIEERVSSIGENAFKECANLKDIVIPDSVKTLGVASFEGCHSLRSVVIPDGITVIPESVFQSCYNLSDVNIPNSVVIIGDFAFLSCAIHNILLPNGLTTIGVGAFEHCGNLTQISIPNTVTSIGQSAFCGAGLVSVMIPEGIRQLGFGVFQICHNLENVTLPSTLTRIDPYAFNGCNSLKTIEIPESVTYIGSGGFIGCASLNEIVIPDAVEVLGDEAFKDCVALRSIVIPDKVRQVGGSAFSGCTSLEEIQLPEGLETIGDRAFENCSALESIDLPSNVTTIGSGAFQYCTALESISIPGGVTQLPERCFYACGELTSVMLPDGLTQIGNSAFEGCGKLPAITIPENVSEIGDRAFSGCIRLTNISY